MLRLPFLSGEQGYCENEGYERDIVLQSKVYPATAIVRPQ
jgi:hypothetical protein